MLRHVGFFVATPLLAASALLTPQLVTATHPVAAAVEDLDSAGALDPFSVPRDAVESETNEDESTDVSGNR